MESHQTIGPARTTVVGIAERAGVTRATVYRHFPDDVALFDACSAHWLAQQVPPDPTSWAHIAGAAERTQLGLADLYRFYRSGEPMLFQIYRDKQTLPVKHRHRLDLRDEEIRDLLLAGFAATRRSHRLRAVIGHAVSYWTWRSLCMEQKLSNLVAVDLMVDLATSAAGLDSPGGSRSER